MVKVVETETKLEECIKALEKLDLNYTITRQRMEYHAYLDLKNSYSAPHSVDKSYSTRVVWIVEFTSEENTQ